MSWLVSVREGGRGAAVRAEFLSCHTRVVSRSQPGQSRDEDKATVSCVPGDDGDEVVGAILRTARTGNDGDGHVLVLPVEHRYNIHKGIREVS
jgi:nitrogen regulatory protein PII